MLLQVTAVLLYHAGCQYGWSSGMLSEPCRLGDSRREEQAVSQVQRRTRRHRTIFTEDQLDALEELFLQNQYPDVNTREKLAQRTHLREERVEVRLLLHHNCAYTSRTWLCLVKANISISNYCHSDKKRFKMNVCQTLFQLSIVLVSEVVEGAHGFVCATLLLIWISIETADSHLWCFHYLPVLTQVFGFIIC